MSPRPLPRPGPLEPYDERDTVFARTRLRPGTEMYDKYYERHPELEHTDERTRALRSLASPGTRRYRPDAGALVDATFEASELVAAAIDQADEGPEFGSAPSNLGTADGAGATGPRHPCAFDSTADLTRWIKEAALFLGAADVGTTRLEQGFVYSHRGRPLGMFGKPIALEHLSAAVLVFPMHHEMVESSPEMIATAETGRVYQQGSAACFILADALKRMGIGARAHVDSSYQVICPPLGVDAGLGELGRNGFLIHPTYGPGVRLGVVTIDAKLEQDDEICHGIAEFCRVCGKCAINCPAGAIPAGDPSIVRGAQKWQMNPEHCYHYWRTQGTDCGLCIRTCPFAKRDTTLHRVVRSSIAASTAFNRFFLWCDDLLYGKKPQSTPPPLLVDGSTELEHD
ncbi:MAG: 4Fe-4S dicluster domain-containing protein [Deltaproteobacteria bacterium]|nr:4Fe-4S dicluster domain-containing protein [Deltaproteobacteria bacterium]